MKNSSLKDIKLRWVPVPYGKTLEEALDNLRGAEDMVKALDNIFPPIDPNNPPKGFWCNMKCSKASLILYDGNGDVQPLEPPKTPPSPPFCLDSELG